MRTCPASLLAAAAIGLLPLIPAHVSAQSREDQQSVRTHMQAGRVMSVREIERRIIPQMRDNEYLGFEYDGVATAYRLKFIKDGQVVWVDVDARTARVLRVSR
jgi:uncharacterized membrane protein YkoI